MTCAGLYFQHLFFAVSAHSAFAQILSPNWFWDGDLNSGGAPPIRVCGRVDDASDDTRGLLLLDLV
jgi:hypothetical protein